MSRSILVLVAAATLLIPAAASAQKVEQTFFNSTIPLRIDHLIGFIPTTNGIHPFNKRVVPITVRVNGKTHRYIFTSASTVTGPSPDIYIKNMISARRYPSPEGVFLDRRLKQSERRYMRVALDLGRDADVLVVASGHPACASGVSRTVARGIAAGKIRTWSAAGITAPASGDRISLRRAGDGLERSVEPRFGAAPKLPKGARAARDGGVSEAASGDQSIAAVTSWSRARVYAQAVCAVSIAGQVPTDASVTALRYPASYPITFVTLKRLGDARPITAAFVKYLKSSQATKAFSQRGMLMRSGG